MPLIRAYRACIQVISPEDMSDAYAAELVQVWNIRENRRYRVKAASWDDGGEQPRPTRYEIWNETGETLYGSCETYGGGEQEWIWEENMALTALDLEVPELIYLQPDILKTIGSVEFLIGPMVDLPDITHPAYAHETYKSSSMAASRMFYDLLRHTHMTTEISITAPDLYAVWTTPGENVAVEVDNETLTGQVESVSITLTPDGTSTALVIRKYTDLCAIGRIPV